MRRASSHASFSPPSLEIASAVAFSFVLMRSVRIEVSGVTRVWLVMNFASPFMLPTLLLPLLAPARADSLSVKSVIQK